jgi:hypothetical protein
MRGRRPLVGHIFISYRSTEADFTLRLAADLKNRGVNVWVDRLDGGIQGGDEWRREIEQAVNTCAAMITVLSPDYVTSKYCRREMNRADDLERPIFPVVLRQIPKEDWPLEIQGIQYTDFSGWPDENAYQQNFARLMQAIHKDAAAQIGTVPTAEIQYLTSLIAELESRKGVLEYVELSAQADAPERPNPHRDTSGWDSSFAVMSSQTQPVVTEPTPQKIQLSNIAEAVAQYPRFVLVGEPGAGKTTTLRRLALDAARKRLDNPHAPLPILLYLPAWGDEPTPADFLHTQLQKNGLAVSAASTSNIFLCLDGLNEMGASGAEKAKKLHAWLHSGSAPQRVIITCRTGDYMGDLNLRLPALLISDMKDFQIREFAANYLGEEAASKFLKRVLPLNDWERIDARHLARLARNPYLLAALVFVYANLPEGELPHNSGSLMQMLTRALWERERQRGTPGWVSFEEMETAFARLAFAMLDQSKPIDVPQSYALKHLGSENLLLLGTRANLVEATGDNVRFYHQLTQEYFAAVELQKGGAALQLKKLPTDVRAQHGGWELNSRWYFVMVALGGISHQTNPIHHWLGKDVLDIVVADLIVTCIESGTTIPSADMDVLLNYLEREVCFPQPYINWEAGVLDQWGMERAYHSQSGKAAHLLGRIGRQAVPVLVNCLTHAESPGGFYGHHAASALSIIRTPEALAAATAWWTQQLSNDRIIETPGQRVCAVAAKGLERLGTPEALVAVTDWALKELNRTDITQAQQQTAAETLTRIATPEALAAVAQWRANPPA